MAVEVYLDRVTVQCESGQIDDHTFGMRPLGVVTKNAVSLSMEGRLLKPCDVGALQRMGPVFIVSPEEYDRLDFPDRLSLLTTIARLQVEVAELQKREPRVYEASF